MPKGKAETTRSRIVECAVSLYKSRGYQGVTVRDICQAGGLTRSAFYYHFNSKEEILEDYYLPTDKDVVERLLPSMSSRSYIEQLFQIVHLYLQRTIGAGPVVLGQMLRRSLDTGALYPAMQEPKVNALLRDLIGKAQEAGQIQNATPPELLLETMLYLFSGITIAWCSRQGKWDVVGDFQKLMSALMLGGIPHGGRGSQRGEELPLAGGGVFPGAVEK